MAKMWNQPDKQPKTKAWASHRRAIVLPDIKHTYQNVSKVPRFKSYSVFMPFAENRMTFRPLPCSQPCCMSFDVDEMQKCEQKSVLGWYNECTVHHREDEKGNTDEKIKPKQRKKKDYANPQVSAKTRKNRITHGEDKKRYKREGKNVKDGGEFKFTPNLIKSKSDLLVNPKTSPLKPSTPAKLTTSVPTMTTLRRRTWKRGGGRPKVIFSSLNFRHYH